MLDSIRINLNKDNYNVNDGKFYTIKVFGKRISPLINKNYNEKFKFIIELESRKYFNLP